MEQPEKPGAPRTEDVDHGQRLSRTAASAAVEAIGWRYLLGALWTSAAVGSLEQAVAVAAAATEACGPDADGHLRLDLRPDRVELSLQTRSLDGITELDVVLARQITDTLLAAGRRTAGATALELARPVQSLEVAIDAMDIPAIKPFWRAVLAYVDQIGDDGPAGAIVDPVGQLPAVWFQQMDAPRLQRNRIHFDITVAHDEAEARVRAALAAGGVLVNDAYARSFWVLADIEGNEICVCTWTDRDERGW
jgi:4a-hydroxytetrahydrobiopterin dehydratase